MDFHKLPAFELARGIKARDYTSEQVLDHFLERTRRLNPAINAIVVMREDQARQQARLADQHVLRASEAMSMLRDVAPRAELPTLERLGLNWVDEALTRELADL